MNGIEPVARSEELLELGIFAWRDLGGAALDAVSDLVEDTLDDAHDGLLDLVRVGDRVRVRARRDRGSVRVRVRVRG